MNARYMINENLTSTICVYLILKKMLAPWESWDAYKLGIIDKTGKKLKHPITSKQRESWDILTRLCWNLKKISDKFVGKSKTATYFTASYLLKDSINYYIINNKEKLNETLLSDMTYSKQLSLYNIIKVLPQHNNLATVIHNNLVEAQHNNLVEIEMIKLLPIVENALKDQNFIYEDGEVIGTVSGDVAQLSPPIGLEKRKKLKLRSPLKIKRIKNEDNR